MLGVSRLFRWSFSRKQTVYPTIDLAKIELNRVRSVRDQYHRLKGDRPDAFGHYSPSDWARVEHVYSQLNEGGKILDVGIGAGQFVNILWESVRPIATRSPLKEAQRRA